MGSQGARGELTLPPTVQMVLVESYVVTRVVSVVEVMKIILVVVAWCNQD